MPYPHSTPTFTGYPLSIGGKRVALSPNGHVGPASYTQVSGGGDPVNVQEFGLTFFERIEGGLTSDGLYRVEAINPTAGPVKAIVLRWTVVATGAEVAAAVDLSGSTVNLFALGY